VAAKPRAKMNARQSRKGIKSGRNTETGKFKTGKWESAARLLAFFAPLACLFGEVGAGTVHAQVETNAEPVLELPLVAPSAVPPAGTFWLYSIYGVFRSDDWRPPIPWNPWGTNVDVSGRNKDRARGSSVS